MTDAGSLPHPYKSYPLTASDPYLPLRRSFIRHVVPLLSESAIKVYLYMLDVTYEHALIERQRQWVFVSAAMSERRIAADMHMSRVSASRGIEDLLERNLIALVAPGTRTEAAAYRVRLDIEVRVHGDGRVEIVAQDDESAAFPPAAGGSDFGPPLAVGGSNSDPLNAGGGSNSDPRDPSEVDQILIRSLNKQGEEEKVYKGAPDEQILKTTIPTVKRGGASPRPGPSLLEREGYSSEPPVGNRRAVAPGAPPMPPAAYLRRLAPLDKAGQTPAQLRELARLPAEELGAPGLYTGDRGVGWGQGDRYPLYVWMLHVLAAVCGENLTDGESTALAEPLWAKAREWVDAGRTPPQVWARFGDAEGYWWASEDHGWKGKRPTRTDIARYWDAAGGQWGRRGVKTSGSATTGAVTAQAETAWSAVQRAISSFGRYRQGELLAALDEVARLAVKAVGLNQLLDLNPEDRYAANKVMRDFKQEYAAAAARLGGQMQTAD